MMTWLKPALIFALTTSVCACSSSSNSSLAGAGPNPCYGPGCYGSSDNGGASSNGGTYSGTIVTDSGTPASTWSQQCGSDDAGCLPDSDAGRCDDLTDGVAGSGDASIGKVADGAASDASSALACRIRSGSLQGSVLRVCEIAGTGRAGAPCRMPADCANGLTCVAEGLATLCRPYCCGDADSCPSNTYCTSRVTLLDKDSWTTGLVVPVCTAAENCPLSEPYPCPTGQNCTCPTGKACMIVRRQGLTACVEPGTGIQGALCPCAAGYVCSNTTFTCLKLCQLTSSANAQTSSQCGAGNSCQASNDVPTDWGVCNDLPFIVN